MGAAAATAANERRAKKAMGDFTEDLGGRETTGSVVQS
jgi:hypothetical protein